MRRLIINADDFGLTPGVNRAIAESHHSGVVTSTTLMANSSAFADAVEIAKSSPTLRIGCHVTLVDGVPLTQLAPASTLVPDGPHFRTGLAKFALAALRGKLSADEIAGEATAQIRKIQEAGLEVTHLDTHKHTHLFPQVLRPLLRAARERGIRAVRNPFGHIQMTATLSTANRYKLLIRWSQLRFLHRYAKSFRAEVNAAGMRTTDGTLGVLITGHLDQAIFNSIIASIPDGIWEFVCHPGYHDADLDQVATRLRASRESELHVLTSSESRGLFDRHNITRVTYADL